MRRQLAHQPLSDVDNTFSTSPDKVTPVDQLSLHLNKPVLAVQGFFPLNEPDVGSAYTNTVCPPPGLTAYSNRWSVLGRFRTEQGTPCTVPATYNQRCHFQEQDLGGVSTRIFFVDESLIFRQSPMCQYSSDHGHATDWHLVHLGVRTI